MKQLRRRNSEVCNGIELSHGPVFLRDRRVQGATCSLFGISTAFVFWELSATIYNNFESASRDHPAPYKLHRPAPEYTSCSLNQSTYMGRSRVFAVQIRRNFLVPVHIGWMADTSLTQRNLKSTGSLRLEPKVMEVLLCVPSQASEVVSKETLIHIDLVGSVCE